RSPPSWRHNRDGALRAAVYQPSPRVHRGSVRKPDRASSGPLLTLIRSSGASINGKQLTHDPKPPSCGRHARVAYSTHSENAIGMTMTVSTVAANLRINGVERTVEMDTRTTLLDALREHLHLTGTKK